MSRHRSRACRGFTFIEVVTTVAIVAVVLPIALNGISLATALGSQTRLRSQAATLARLKLDELAVDRTWQSGSLAGDFGAEQPEFRWSATVGDYDGGTLRQLDVDVAWEGRHGQQHVTMTTLVQSETP